MQLQELSSLLNYNPSDGKLTQKSNTKEVHIDECGTITVYNPKTKVRYKIKANKAAWMLGNNKSIRSDQRVLHKNLDARDLTLKNLMLLSRSVYLEVSDAIKNLEGSLRIVSHPIDMFNYFLIYRKKGKEVKEVCYDAVSAKKKYLRMQLKSAKIVSKYCLVE